MSCEFVDEVTAIPSTTLPIEMGSSVDILGRFSLDGPSGGAACSYSMGWLHVSPGAPFSFAPGEFPATAGVDYTRTFTPSSHGTHVIRVQVSHFLDVPPFSIATDSIDLEIVVVPEHHHQLDPAEEMRGNVGPR